jgi:hypothetical protein
LILFQSGPFSSMVAMRASIRPLAAPAKRCERGFPV